MHQSSILRMNWFLDQFVSFNSSSGNKLRVLDVGSYDVNGSYKPLFNSKKVEYLGLDMENGPNVDLAVSSPYHWPSLKTDSFDLVISGQAFEHNEFFWLTMEEIARVLKPGGKVCIIAPNGFHEHRYPVDCYRFFTDGMIAMARYVQLDVLHASTNAAPSGMHDSWCKEGQEDAILIAQKNYIGPARLINRTEYKTKPWNQNLLLTGLEVYQKKRENKPQKLVMKLYRLLERFN